MRSVIFDFDGTLADTLPVVVEIAEGILGQKIPSDDIERYRNMTIKQILKEAKMPLYKVPGLLVKGRPLLQKRMNEVNIFNGLDNVIEELSKQHDLYVVSSNSAGIINKFLSDHYMKKYFKKVYGSVGIFSKAHALKRVAKREGFSLSDAIYIGDEVRDIESAKKIKVPIISVVWGFNGEEILQKYKPDFLAKKPQDIVKFIND